MFAHKLRPCLQLLYVELVLFAFIFCLSANCSKNMTWSSRNIFSSLYLKHINCSWWSYVCGTHYGNPYFKDVKFHAEDISFN